VVGADDGFAVDGLTLAEEGFTVVTVVRLVLVLFERVATEKSPPRSAAMTNTGIAQRHSDFFLPGPGDDGSGPPVVVGGAGQALAGYGAVGG
jgi:hypothetical protein